jgi:hypothetical protein
MFGPVLESSRLSLSLSTPQAPGGEVNNSRDGSQRDCFMMSLLGDDTISRGVMRWMVYPTPCTGLWLTVTHRGDRAYL